jgi:cytochrome P450
VLTSLKNRLVSALAKRHIRKHGIDLASIGAIPDDAKAALTRDGVDTKPEMAQFRREGPLHRIDMPFNFNAYLVTGHSEAREILTAKGDVYSNDIRHLFSGQGPATKEDVGGLGFTDPPKHTHLRKIVTPEFTMRRLARLEPMIRDIVAVQVAELAASSSPDLARDLAFPVPFNTICALLGIDNEDRERFAQLGTARFDATNGAAGAFGAVSAQREFIHECVVKQRVEPGPGLLGQIIRDVGDDIDDWELTGLADGIFTGGYETTAGMIALGTIVLLRDRRYVEMVTSGDKEQLDAVIEELLRYLSVVQVAFPRFAKEDMELFGHQIKAGDVLLSSLVAANRDPAVMGEDPDSFNPLRVPESGHLAFGHGFHRCIGAELARMELRIALPAIFENFPNLALAVDESDLDFRQMSFVFGVDTVPVTLN